MFREFSWLFFLRYIFLCIYIYWFTMRCGLKIQQYSYSLENISDRFQWKVSFQHRFRNENIHKVCIKYLIFVCDASRNYVWLSVSIAVKSWEHSERKTYVETILRTKIQFKHLKSEFMKSASIWKFDEKPHGIKNTKNHLHFDWN